jgi:DNA replication protein DnaC
MRARGRTGRWTGRWTGRFASVQELLAKCRGSFRKDEDLEEILESVSKPDALLLDDLGTENPTAFARETVALLIDRAYRKRQTIIVTSNYDLESLVERLDARSVDRLVEICFAVKLTGPSYRQKRGAQRARLLNLPVSDAVQ